MTYQYGHICDPFCLYVQLPKVTAHIPSTLGRVTGRAVLPLILISTQLTSTRPRVSSPVSSSLKILFRCEFFRWILLTPIISRPNIMVGIIRCLHPIEVLCSELCECTESGCCQRWYLDLLAVPKTGNFDSNAAVYTFSVRCSTADRNFVGWPAALSTLSFTNPLARKIHSLLATTDCCHNAPVPTDLLYGLSLQDNSGKNNYD